jgi:hypothetical protein
LVTTRDPPTAILAAVERGARPFLALSRDCPGEAEPPREIALAFLKLSEERLALGTSFGQFLLKFGNLLANDFYQIQ